jgi:RHS repeat-associated protein
MKNLSVILRQHTCTARSRSKKLTKNLIITLLLTTQFLLFASPTLASVTNYTYDANGNMESDGITCYEYNEANRLSKIKDCSTGQLQAEYLYDDTGDRGIKKMYKNGQLSETIYSRNQFFETKIDAQGGEENTSYYYIDGRLIAKKNPDGSVNYIHRDHLGSSTVVTDDQGNLIEESEYYPYGQLSSGGYEVKYGYTGQEKDWEGNQLNYYGARYYDAQLGRFTQPDSMLPNPYDPQQINRYAYVRNNPIKYVDPSGNILITAVLIVAGAIAIDQGWNIYEDLQQRSIINDPNSTSAEIAAAKSYKNDIWQTEANFMFMTGADSLLPGDNIFRAGSKFFSQRGAKAALKELGGQGFGSFYKFKKAMGSAGKGKAWHHIVEQHEDNLLKFGNEQIHNTKNVISLPDMAGDVHKKITGYYNSIDPTYSTTEIVRDVIKNWSFEDQYNFGIRQIKRFGGDDYLQNAGLGIIK